MKISARNQLEGTISAVNEGPVSTEVTLDLAGGDKLVAVVTSESAKTRAAAFARRKSVRGGTRRARRDTCRSAGSPTPTSGSTR